MALKNKIGIIGVLVLFGLIGYLVLFGKLFPYSPITIGFEKHELRNTIVYSQNGVTFNDYENIDTLIPAVVKFHDLKYLKKPKVILFSDSASYIRHSPSKARFCVFYNSRLLVSPWALKDAQNEKISLSIYLTHELSHSLLHQHSGLIRAMKYPKWLLEGIAVHSSAQMGTSFYPDKKETFRLIQSGNFIPPDYFKTRHEDGIILNVENRIPFMYAEFACIVDYLVRNFGKEKFLVYMKSLTKEKDHNRVFKQIYGIDFEQVLIDFKESVRSNSDTITIDQKQPTTYKRL